MNPSFWGPNAWDFLHEIPYMFPDEFLLPKDISVIVQTIHVTFKILPCLACSVSAQGFEKKAKMINAIVKTYDDGDGPVRYVTRANVAKFLDEFHNKVNNKLSKTPPGLTWRDRIHERPKWVQHLLIFLAAVIWVYPKRKEDADQKGFDLDFYYRYYFTVCIPQVLKYQKFGKVYRTHLEAHPFENVFGDRKKMFRWIHKLRVACSDTCGEPWDYETLCIFMQSMEARKPCGENSMGCE